MHLKDPEKSDYFDLGDAYMPKRVLAHEISDNIYETEMLFIATLAMDFPSGTTMKYRKELETKWMKILPGLDKVKVLWVRHLADDSFLEAVCQMKNLEWLRFETSRIESLAAIAKLQGLKKLELRSSKLVDISPVLSLKNLEALGIEASFRIENYETLGQMKQLKALRFAGDAFAPKNLKLDSLLPYTGLSQLEHLELSAVSVKDKSYEAVLQLEKLVRLDIGSGISSAVA